MWPAGASTKSAWVLTPQSVFTSVLVLSFLGAPVPARQVPSAGVRRRERPVARDDIVERVLPLLFVVALPVPPPRIPAVSGHSDPRNRCSVLVGDNARDRPESVQRNGDVLDGLAEIDRDGRARALVAARDPSNGVRARLEPVNANGVDVEPVVAHDERLARPLSGAPSASVSPPAIVPPRVIDIVGASAATPSSDLDVRRVGSCDHAIEPSWDESAGGCPRSRACSFRS